MKPTSKGTVARDMVNEQAQREIEQAVAGGLGELTLREMLGALLSSVGYAERRAYLADADDKANGSYSRALQVGSVPIELEVPRTRSGAFRPELLPPPYARGYPADTQALLWGLLSSARSVNAAKVSLRQLGLSVAEPQLEAVAHELIDELTLRNSAPIAPDLLAVFFDGKYVEVRDGERLRPACIYVVVGLHRDGRKRVLACTQRFGRENLEDWKKVLRGLLERGLRHVLIVVHDDFSGLLGFTTKLFVGADIQLCIVHMQRNAATHLNKTETVEFQQRMRALKASWDPERASAQFDDLCDRFDASSPSFIAELRKKREHYLAFLHYPTPIRRGFSTTNAVEAINGQLERLRRNNGGYFHNEDALSFKLGMATSFLENGKWRSPAASVRAALHQLNAMFETRFEQET